MDSTKTMDPHKGSVGMVRSGHGCTRWQRPLHWVSKRAERKLLIKAASVHYPVRAGVQEVRNPLNSIHSLLTGDRLRAAIDLLDQDTSPGIDGVDWDTFLKMVTPAYLERLSSRVRSRRYTPGPNKLVDFSEANGKVRSLRIPPIEVRVIQRAWLLIVEDVFEQHFLDCSYGYRPGRSCHQALDAIATEVKQRGVVYVLDADFKSYFDTIPHQELMNHLRTFITDPVFLSFCYKTLKAGTVQNGRVLRSNRGAAQGSVLSPLLANLYAHRVLDLYVHEVLAPSLQGWCRFIRYADDFVLLTGSLADAEKAKELIESTVQKHGLSLHPDKTSIRNMSDPELRPLEPDEESRDLLFLGFELAWHQVGKVKWELVGRTAPGRRERAIERWKKDLERLEVELRGWRRLYRRRTCTEFLERLDRSVANHIWGYHTYYRVEGNESDLCRYETEVFRLTAAFWRRHIDPKGHNPYEGCRDEVWPQVRMRNLCELSSKRLSQPRRKEGSADEIRS